MSALYSVSDLTTMTELTPPMFRPRLLLVDANDGILRVLSRKLRSRFEVVPLTKGASALGRLREERFDILMLDLGVADVPAHEVLETAHASQLPVIVTSARVEVVEGVTALAYLQKPFDAATLDRALADAVTRLPPRSSAGS